jgi:transcription elongation factor Elf1
MKIKCGWCGNKKGFRVMECGVKVPLVCKQCGSLTENIGWKELNDRISLYEKIIEAQKELLVCYRLNVTPKEKTLDFLHKHSQKRGL